MPKKAKVVVTADAIVVADGGWAKDIPDFLIEKVKEERSIITDTATDAEVTVYLFTLSLITPLSDDVAQIYFYMAGKYMPQNHSIDFIPDELSRDQMELLQKIKRDIYDKRQKHLGKSR